MWAVAIRRLFLLIPGLLGVLLVGFLLINVSAEFGATADPEVRAFRAHFALDKPSLLNTRFTLSTRDVEPPLRRIFDAETTGIADRHALRATERLTSFGRDAVPALLTLLATANESATLKHTALLTAVGRAASTQTQAGEADAGAAPNPTPHRSDEVGRGVAVILDTPAILAVLERPATRDRLPDPDELRACGDAAAAWVLAEAGDELADSAVRVALQRPDIRRLLLDYADARRWRRHVANWALTLTAHAFGEIPYLDDAAYEAALGEWRLFAADEMAAAKALVAAHEAQTLAQALRRAPWQLSPKIDGLVRKQIIEIAARDRESVAARKAARWADWYDANATRFYRPTPERAVMLVGDTRLAAYLNRMLPDPERGRWLPDVGHSRAGHDAWRDVGRHAGLSLALLVVAVALAFLTAIFFGVTAAVKRQQTTYRVLLGMGYVFAAMPALVLGVVLVAALGGVWPTQGISSGDWSRMTTLDRFTDAVVHLVLPAFTLAVAAFAMLLGTTLNRLRLATYAPHVIAARARGLDEWTVISRHALKPLLGVLIPVVAELLPRVLAALLVVEWLFDLPGVGRLVIDAVTATDYPVVIATVLLFGAVGVVGKCLAEIAAAALDPQLTRPGR